MGARVRAQGSATGSQGWITEGLGSHTTGLTSRFTATWEITRVFQLCGHMEKYRTFQRAAGEQSLQQVRDKGLGLNAQVLRVEKGGLDSTNKR